jgi:hypothetical protein
MCERQIIGKQADANEEETTTKNKQQLFPIEYKWLTNRIGSIYNEKIDLL